MRLPADVRHVALREFLEEAAAQTLGAAETLGFWRSCFGPGSPKFFLTAPGSDEHDRLWSTARASDAAIVT